MATPYFSIIITTHQRPTLLARALASVRASSFKDHEMIVVADVLDAPQDAAVMARVQAEVKQLTTAFPVYGK